MEFLSDLEAQQERIQQQRHLQEQLMKSAEVGRNICNVCGAEFARKHHLKRHMVLHTSIKPYQCDATNCQKSFARKDYLDMHRKSCPYVYNDAKNGVNGTQKVPTSATASKSEVTPNEKAPSRKGAAKPKARDGPSRRRKPGEVFSCPLCPSQDGNGNLTFTTKGALTRHNNEKHAQK